MKRNFIINAFNMGRVIVRPFIPGPGVASSSANFKITTAPEAFSFSTSQDGRQVMSAQLSGVPVWCDFYLKEIREGGLSIQILQSIVTISMKKNIVKTVVQGRNGTVKEYISDGDYQVTIRGAFADSNPSRFPIEDVNTLYNVCRLPEAVEVVGEFFQLFGIHNLVIEDFEFPQKEGYQNLQAFSIKAVSDEPIELKLASE